MPLPTNSQVSDEPSTSPQALLVRSLLERSPADVAWLAWLDGEESTVVARDTGPINPASIGEFPPAWERPLAIRRGEGDGSWAVWCRSRGILACQVAPVYDQGRLVGSVGLASATVDSLSDGDLRQLQLGAALAHHARFYEIRLDSVRGLFEEVSRTLENALALDRALRLPPTYREIARSIGASLDATYCQIAIRDVKQALTIRATGGRRPPRRIGGAVFPLGQLRHCAKSLHEHRAVVLSFQQHDAGSEPERLALFSPTTKSGVILPFFVGPRTQGVLIIGEERESRCPPLSAERVAILALFASRIAHIMRMARRLDYERSSQRRRRRQMTVERQRLARDVHDEVGQSLTGLLVHIRCALHEGTAGPDMLKLFEETASKALNGARTLAYGVRHLEGGVGPLEEARSYAETMLRGVRCRLSWSEDVADSPIAPRTLREVGRVIKESVSNIVRHAHAECARVRVEYPDRRIRVTIRDDGVGFNVRDVLPNKEGRGLGLVGCSERLELIGGTFDIQSASTGGTVVVIDAPRR